MRTVVTVAGISERVSRHKLGPLQVEHVSIAAQLADAAFAKCYLQLFGQYASIV